MRLNEKWWRANYQLLRLAVVPVAKRILRVQTDVVGELPVTRPVFLAPVHRTSVDIYAVGAAAAEFVSFVSDDSFGHRRCVNWLQEQLTRSLGSVIWPGTRDSTDLRKVLICVLRSCPWGSDTTTSARV